MTAKNTRGTRFGTANIKSPLEDTPKIRKKLVKFKNPRVHGNPSFLLDYLYVVMLTHHSMDPWSDDPVLGHPSGIKKEGGRFR